MRGDTYKETIINASRNDSERGAAVAMAPAPAAGAVSIIVDPPEDLKVESATEPRVTAAVGAPTPAHDLGTPITSDPGGACALAPPSPHGRCEGAARCMPHPPRQAALLAVGRLARGQPAARRQPRAPVSLSRVHTAQRRRGRLIFFSGARRACIPSSEMGTR